MSGHLWHLKMSFKRGKRFKLMMVAKLQLIVLCVMINGGAAIGYKILGVSISTMKSQHIFFSSLMKGLANDGNEVTYISPFQSSKPIKNLREILFDNSFDINNSEGNESNSIFHSIQLKFAFFVFLSVDRPIRSAIDINGLNCFSLTNIIYRISTEYLKWAVNSTSFQNFLQQKDQFDVVLVLVFVSDALLSLGHYFNAPVIGISPHAANKWSRDLVGAPNLASFIPHTLTGYTDRMNFWQRTYNSLCYLYEDVMNPLIYAPAQQEILDSLYPNMAKMPPLDVFKRNVSLVLYNSLPIFEIPAPVQSNLIPVGGLFIDRENSEPLPDDLNDFLKTKEVIYVAFGSNVEFSHFDEYKQHAIINAFDEYPNMRIILQSKQYTAIPSHNDNDVMIRSWFPQQSILAHKNVKLFISHGGLLLGIEFCEQF